MNDETKETTSELINAERRHSATSRGSEYAQRLYSIRESAGPEAMVICRAWHGERFAWPGYGSDEWAEGEVAKAKVAVVALGLDADAPPQVRAAEKRCCDALVALAKADNAWRLASCGRGGTAEGHEMAAALYAKAEHEACAAGTELARLRGAT